MKTFRCACGRKLQPPPKPEAFPGVCIQWTAKFFCECGKPQRYTYDYRDEMKIAKKDEIS